MLFSLNINRMVHKNIITFLHHLTKHVVLREILPNPFCQNIVRRSQFHDLSICPHQKMTVTGTHVEFVALFFQTFFQCVHQNSRILRADLTCTVVQNMSLFIGCFLFGKCHHVAAQRHIRRFHIYTDTKCLQRRASRIIDLRVITHHR